MARDSVGQGESPEETGEGEQTALRELLSLYEGGEPTSSRRLRMAFYKWQAARRVSDRVVDAQMARDEMLDGLASRLRDFTFVVAAYGRAEGDGTSADERIDAVVRRQRALMLALADSEVAPSVDYLRDLRKVYASYVTIRMSNDVVLLASLAALFYTIVALAYLTGLYVAFTAAMLCLLGTALLVVLAASLVLRARREKVRASGVWQALRDPDGYRSGLSDLCRDFIAHHPRPRGLLGEGHGDGR